MFSITTAEIRWFKKGKIPQVLLDWIQSNEGIYEDQSPRTDVYLIIDSVPTIGIKVREGRMEIKKKLSTVESFSIEAISGYPETWIKWSSKTADDVKEDYPLLQDKDQWIQIQKKRTLRKFEVSASGQLLPFPETFYPEVGIAIEVSDLEVNDQSWWTFALECFGPQDRVLADLKTVIPTLLTNFPPIELTKDLSMAYPEWIGRLQKKP